MLWGGVFEKDSDFFFIILGHGLEIGVYFRCFNDVTRFSLLYIDSILMTLID